VLRLVLVLSVATSAGCGIAGILECSGGDVKVAFSDASGANADTSPYATKSVATTKTSDEINVQTTRCPVGLGDTNRAIFLSACKYGGAAKINCTGEGSGAPAQGESVPLTDSADVGLNEPYLTYSEGGIDPTAQKSWVSNGGSLTVTTLGAKSGLLTFSTPMKPTPANGKTNATGTFSLAGTIAIEF